MAKAPDNLARAERIGGSPGAQSFHDASDTQRCSERCRLGLFRLTPIDAQRGNEATKAETKPRLQLMRLKSAARSPRAETIRTWPPERLCDEFVGVSAPGAGFRC